MEQETKKAAGTFSYDPAIVAAWKITKKVIKYFVYFVIIYFAIEGFMAWE